MLQKCLTISDGSFNVYDDLRKKLVAEGIPKEEVAFIHEASTDTKKNGTVWQRLETVHVRVLIGSTFKMGAGTNVQDLSGSHAIDLDCSVASQSDVGRILRTFKIKKNVEVTDNGKIII